MKRSVNIFVKDSVTYVRHCSGSEIWNFLPKLQSSPNFSRILCRAKFPGRWGGGGGGEGAVGHSWASSHYTIYLWASKIAVSSALHAWIFSYPEKFVPPFSFQSPFLLLHSTHPRICHLSFSSSILKVVLLPFFPSVELFLTFLLVSLSFLPIFSWSYRLLIVFLYIKGITS